MPDSGADDLLSSILRSYWGLTGTTVVQRRQSYRTRTVYRVKTDQGRFAVKVDTQPTSEFDGSHDVQAAIAHEIPQHVPFIVESVSGALTSIVQGRRIVVYEDIPSGAPAENTATWSRLGRIMARLHGLTTETRPFAVPIMAAARELERTADQYPFGNEFRRLTDRVRRIESEPIAVIHGEVNLTNVLRRSNGELVLIDWDNAGAGPIALDLGYPLICVFLTEDLHWQHDNARAFYSAYRAHSQRPVPTREQIIDAALMHAMRYLRFGDHDRRWSRIQYALAHESELAAAVGD